MKNIYNFQATTAQGKPLPMSDFKGKALLLVNTATKCGLAPQFSELESLHQKYKDKGLVIIGFPCNQFLNQEPETDDTVEEYCQINHGVTFQLTTKIKVNGKEADPIFKYLKDQLPGKTGKKIKWNFTKFLISTEGEPVKRYAPRIKPLSLMDDIEALFPITN